MLPRPLSVVANEDYTLSITFNNGEKRLFNMTPYLIYPVSSLDEVKRNRGIRFDCL